MKGRDANADTITVSANEIRAGYNAGDKFALAIVQVEQGFVHEPRYVWNPFGSEPSFDTRSINFGKKELLERAVSP